jgi:hypothetical protein
MAQTKEYREKLGRLKGVAANEREIDKQQKSPYKRMVKKLPHKKGFVAPPHLEPSKCTRG